MGLMLERKKTSREKDKDWLWINWNKPIKLWENDSFNIGKYLEDEGVKLE